MIIVLLGVIIIILLFLLGIPSLRTQISFWDNTMRLEPIFKVPRSLTKLAYTEKQTKLSQLLVTNRGSLLERYNKKFEEITGPRGVLPDKVNILQFPSFFNCNEHWKGCLPRALNQMSCGSCWGFASVTCLSSRFYIESCTWGGSCGNYPQINSGSIDDVYSNINEEYNFNKIYLKNITDYIGSQYITRDIWINNILQMQKNIMSLENKYYITQMLINILDFQGLGSIDLKDVPSVQTRAAQVYDMWLQELNAKYSRKDIILNTNQLLDYLRKQPLALSAEKLITCCIKCYELEFEQSPTKTINNPSCLGGSLQDAWILLRDIGVPETLCVGYNLGNYQEGDKVPTCRELEGPFFSFCTGMEVQNLEKNYSTKELNKIVNKIELKGAYPPSVEYQSKYPWIDPQLMRFTAKNAYVISPSQGSWGIQKEIMQRGPVNSGFYIYDDFEMDFGGLGLGGQLYNGGNPLGSSSTSLIYMRDPKKKSHPVGGHAITIVGWGTFKYTYKDKNYNIPYWTCLNSWGTLWGHGGFPKETNRNGVPENLKGGGYFWIVRGINNCGIEDNVVCGQPNIENLSYPDIVDKYGWGLDPPTQGDVTFLGPLDTKDIDVNGKKLEILHTIPGGGGYVDYVPPKIYQIKSMKAPSPFTMFWQKSRPVYCIGNTINQLSLEDKVVKINLETWKFLEDIRSYIYKNPLLLIGDADNQEQVQLLKLEPKQIIIGRGINFNIPKVHPKNSRIKIFPYQDLTIDFLDNRGFTSC